MHLAKWNNAALRAKVKASGDRDVDGTVFRQGLAEVEKGWDRGTLQRRPKRASGAGSSSREGSD
eukprot:666860-Amphidinium_carterae.1